MPEDYKNENNQSGGHDAKSSDKNQGQFPQFGNINFQDQNSKSGPNDSIGKRIEAAKSNGWGSQVSSLISNHKKSIVIGLVAALLFGAGSLISRNADENSSKEKVAGISTSTTDENETKGESEDGADSEQSEGVLEIKLDDDGQIVLGQGGPDPEEKPEIAEQKRSVERDGDIITITAKPGDGITHLSRTALTDYLNRKGESLSPEQKLYAEDYVQNRTGDNYLEIGQKLSFSEILLDEAVEKANALEDWQIENLKKYTR